MKVIILAAGEGKRLRPYTEDRPKCMVEISEKSLLHWQLEVIESVGIKREDIAIVDGYLSSNLFAEGVHRYHNPKFDQSNMVTTLFCAQEFMCEDDDLLICYGDIVYTPKVLETILNNDSDIAVAADLNWQELWKLRMEEPLLDAETFKVGSNGNVIELGKKPISYDEVQAQYIGLVKVKANKINDFITFYNSLDCNASYDGNDFDNMYMTSFIQNLIDNNWSVKPAFFEGGWFEVDTTEDLDVYTKNNMIKKLSLV